MKVISSEPYNYRLVYEQDSYFLFVVCGASAAIYEKKIELSEDEVNKIKDDHEYLKNLLQKIRLE
ncbi:hypothetical protein [Vibrio rhizosphaerae]|uniref:hypothetical protein n=1 Tax=Vibrio rhizosphaerae TaxID=398736 RepID=UPI000571B666|nr:hypothetical protein [Vibrio rhizosphaerae]